MKSLQLFFFILFVFFFISCNQDAPINPPVLNGQWQVAERIVQSNYPSVDTIVNDMFKDDLGRFSLLMTFSKNEVATTASIENVEYRRLTESFAIQSDSLIVEDMLLGYPVKSHFLLSYTIFTTKRTVTQKDLITMLTWIEMLDPNGTTILPKDIKGEYRMKAIRISE